MDKSKLLDQCGALGEDRTLLARVLDRAKQASERNIPAATDFLSPAQQAQARRSASCGGIPETAYIRWGGYDGAEAAVLLSARIGWTLRTPERTAPSRCLRAAFREGEKPDPPGFFGQSHGHGDRPGENRRYFSRAGQRDVLVLDTVAEFLAQSWESAGRVKLRVAEIDPGCVHIPEIRREERRDTVSSLRLDAVCSTGFRMARGKAAALIESGRVQLNWRECTKPDRTVSEGDTVSARGFGEI